MKKSQPKSFVLGWDVLFSLYSSLLFLFRVDGLDLQLDEFQIVLQLLHLAVHLVDEAVALLA